MIEALHIFLNIMVVIFLAITLAFWGEASSVQLFTTSWFDFVWEIFSILIILGGILALLIRRPPGWGMGFGMLALIGLGYAAQLGLSLPQNDFLGAVRLGLLAAYPLLLSLPYRFLQPQAAPAPAVPSLESIPAPHPITHERRRYSTDPKTLQSFVGLVNAQTPLDMGTATARLIGHVMVSDLCYLVSMPDANGQLTLETGYDLIREEPLQGVTVIIQRVPQISSALHKGRSLRLSAETDSMDLRSLGDVIGLTNPGNLLLIPLQTEESVPIGGVILFSPYSNRVWTADDQNFITPLLPGLVQILQRTAGSLSSDQIERLKSDLQFANEEIEILRQQQQDMLQQLDTARDDEGQRSTQEENLAALVAVQQEYQSIIDLLQRENDRLQEAASQVAQAAAHQPLENDDLQAAFRLAQTQSAQLQNALVEANRRISELEQLNSGISLSNEHAEVIASIAQELRQPMSSITGYTDLLLGESVGILGALQRKFLERIKASTERLRSLSDDLVQTVALESGSVNLSPEAVDLALVIDNAIQYTSAQIREKDISLQVDLPEQFPQLHADRDALQQVVIHLLQNAGAASPVEGVVRLKVGMQSENGQQDFVLLQVTDSGGGIPTEELPRVFSRLYRADNALIQGVGETGVGLSIAKTLVEAHGGRIWVDTQMGETSTFSVLLPVYQGSSPTQTT